MKRMVVLFLLMVISTILCATGIDYSNGEYGPITIRNEKPEVILPHNFDVDRANAEFQIARENEDMETANRLSLQINKYWKENRVIEVDPAARDYSGGTSSPRVSNLTEGNNREPVHYAPCWGTDVRIDPRDGIRGAQVVSLSNGELYTISIHYSGGTYTRVTSRSTNGGNSWAVCDEFATTIYLSDARLSVADDTLIMSYIMENSSNEYQAWVKVVEPGPGPTLNTIYYGTPSGGFISDLIQDFVVTNDGPNYVNKYIYATWAQANNSDQTYIRFARSNDMDVSSWAINDTVDNTNGPGIYYNQNQIANGNATTMIIAVRLHPAGYPQTFDEQIRAYHSSNGGSDWLGAYATPLDNHKDEYEPALAGSHINDNFVCLAVQDDTASGPYNPIINNYYTLDAGANWTEDGWVSPDTNYLPYVMVDYNSTAFWAVFRKDLANGDEEVRFKQGAIGDPTDWTQSSQGIVNDDKTDLSSTYGPTVCYDYNPDHVCVAWTDYHGYVYSIWFDKMAWTVGVEEPVVGDINTEMFSVVPNGKMFRINYSVTSPGPVSINIYDISGRSVANLLNERKEAGTYSLDYEPDFASGSYFFTIQTQEGIQTKQTFYLK